jgi:hypothetical protein
MAIDVPGVGSVPLTITPKKLAELIAAVPWPKVQDEDAMEGFEEVHRALLAMDAAPEDF